MVQIIIIASMITALMFIQVIKSYVERSRESGIDDNVQFDLPVGNEEYVSDESTSFIGSLFSSAITGLKEIFSKNPTQEIQYAGLGMGSYGEIPDGKSGNGLKGLEDEISIQNYALDAIVPAETNIDLGEDDDIFAFVGEGLDGEDDGDDEDDEPLMEEINDDSIDDPLPQIIPEDTDGDEDDEKLDIFNEDDGDDEFLIDGIGEVEEDDALAELDYLNEGVETVQLGMDEESELLADFRLIGEMDEEDDSPLKIYSEEFILAKDLAIELEAIIDDLKGW